MILAVTGLSREARILSRPTLKLAVGGGCGLSLRQRIETALDQGVRRIVSVGVCGALSPELEVGDCVVATSVVTATERFDTHPSLTKKLLERAPDAVPVVLAGSDTIIADRETKQRLHREMGAAVADMESHIAARIATERGLPFSAFRVVSDSAEHELPPAALVAMASHGGINVLAVLRSLISTPRQIPALIRTAFEAEKAFRVLMKTRHVVDPLPAYADMGELSLDVT